MRNLIIIAVIAALAFGYKYYVQEIAPPPPPPATPVPVIVTPRPKKQVVDPNWKSPLETGSQKTAQPNAPHR